MKKIIIMFVLVASFVVNINTVFACSPAIGRGNGLGPSTKVYLEPIVIRGGIHNFFPAKGYYLKVAHVGGDAMCDFGKGIYISYIWVGVILLGLFYFIRKYGFKKQK